MGKWSDSSKFHRYKPLRGCAAIYNDLFGSYLHATNACEHFSGTLVNFCDGGSRRRLIWERRSISSCHYMDSSKQEQG